MWLLSSKKKPASANATDNAMSFTENSISEHRLPPECLTGQQQQSALGNPAG